jgi:hypothetical protein
MNGGSTLYADLDQLLAWYAAARPGGAWVRWASGTAIDWSHATARQVSEWRRAGSIEEPAEDKRKPGEWLVRRAFELGGEGSDQGLRQAPAERPLSPIGERMVAMLRDRRAAGADRPSYREMASALGLRNREAARHLFQKLERKGLLDTG